MKKHPKPVKSHALREWQRDLNPPKWDALPNIMEAWVNKKLDDLWELNRLPSIEDELFPDAHAVRAGWRGDLSALKALYPHLAPFLHVPEGEPPEPVLPPTDDGKEQPLDHAARVKLAVKDVRTIRALWKSYFGNKKRQNLITTETIAAKRNGVDVDTLINALKKV